MSSQFQPWSGFSSTALIRSVCCAATLWALSLGGVAHADTPADLRALAEAAAAADPARLSAAARALDADDFSAFELTSAERSEFQRAVAEAYLEAGLAGEAAQTLRIMLREQEASLGPSSFGLVPTLRLLAAAELRAGRLEAAQAAVERAIGLVRSELGADHPSLRFDFSTLTDILELRATADPSRVQGMSARQDGARAELALLSAAAVSRRAQLDAASGDATPDPTRGVGSGDSASDLVRVYFGTNRTANENAPPSNAFGYTRARMQYGVATVSVPRGREVGAIPRANIWVGEFRPDPSRHVIVTDLDRYDGLSEFTTALQRQVTRSRRKEVLVYIHGFNTDFRAGLERAAQLAVDLELDGAPILYSWPSRGGLLGYVADGNEVTQPIIEDLSRFLQTVAQNAGAERVLVVAHSMGNRFLLAALDEMTRSRARGSEPLFDELVFAAPDVDAEDFRARLPRVTSLAQRTTLYASNRDRALQISRMINGGYARAGDAARPLVLPGLQTIDTSAACSTDFCHEEFVGVAMDDFRSIVWLSLAPQNRCVLTTRSEGRRRFWRVQSSSSESCEPVAFRSAITLLRRLGREPSIRLLENQIELLRQSGDVGGARSWAATLRVLRSIGSR